MAWFQHYILTGDRVKCNCNQICHNLTSRARTLLLSLVLLLHSTSTSATDSLLVAAEMPSDAASKHSLSMLFCSGWFADRPPVKLCIGGEVSLSNCRSVKDKLRAAAGGAVVDE